MTLKINQRYLGYIKYRIYQRYLEYTKDNKDIKITFRIQQRNLGYTNDRPMACTINMNEHWNELTRTI